MKSIIAKRGSRQGQVIRIESSYDELPPALRADLLTSSVWGHPSNRPTTEAAARRWTYGLDPTASTIIEVSRPFGF